MKDIVEIINDNQEFLRIYNNQKEEIERLKGVYKKNLELVDKMYSKDKEIEKLHSIIKEVREYIENNDIMKVEKEGKLKGGIFLDKGLFEILDKEK